MTSINCRPTKLYWLVAMSMGTDAPIGRMHSRWNSSMQ
jgi:hypothetical protein